MEKRLNVRRANRLLVMFYNEWKTLENVDRPLKIEWNVMHMFSAAQLAKLYAIKNNLDIELCSIIAIVHDIAVVEGKFREDHDRLAKDYVLGAIERYNSVTRGSLPIITSEETEIILESVLVHSDKSTYTDNPYVEMLKNVDSLDRYLYGIKTEEAYYDRTEELLKDFMIIN